MRWAEGRVSVDDSVASPRPASGQWLSDHFFEGISAQTFGLIQFRFENLWLGPVVLLDFGWAAIGNGHDFWQQRGDTLNACFNFDIARHIASQRDSNPCQTRISFAIDEHALIY